MHHYYAYVYVRIMQALGAYGFRGFYERKTHFLQSVPYALKNVRWLLEHVELPIALPALMDAFARMAASEKLQKLATRESSAGGKRDTNFSAEDLQLFIIVRACRRTNGHGGGFVFDARSIPNPGREEQIQNSHGQRCAGDRISESAGKRASVFCASVMSLVDASVKTYQPRGFTSLMVSFGCTGGQHRSVYFAEQLAKRLSGRNGVEVVVRHRRAGEMGK